MKKIIISAVVTLGSILGISVPAMAQANISNTGPGSVNTITSNNTNTCTAVMNNTAVVTNTNNQAGASGAAVVSGNTGSGGASTGSVNNSSSSNTQLSLTNGNPCAPAAALPSGGSGGSGGTNVQTAAITLAGGQGAGADMVSALPETGQTAPAEQLFIGSALLSGLVAVGGVLRKLFGEAV